MSSRDSGNVKDNDMPWTRFIVDETGFQGHYEVLHLSHHVVQLGIYADCVAEQDLVAFWGLFWTNKCLAKTKVQESI